MRRAFLFGILLSLFFSTLAYGGQVEKFEDGSSEKILNFPKEGGSIEVKIKIPKNVYILSATLNLENLGYPADVILNFLNKTIWSYEKKGYGYMGKQFLFEDNTKEKDVLTVGEGSASFVFLIPMSAVIKNASLEIIGFGRNATLSNITIDGESSIQFGTAIASGDINSDGYKDIVIGAPMYGNKKGMVYIYHWSNDGYKLNKTIEGIEGSSFGSAVATADVNNDSYADIIVGGSEYNTDTGFVHIYYGNSSGITDKKQVLIGEKTYSKFGFSVSSMGDVNGDGYDDIIIGAPNMLSRGGKVYGYYGSENGIADTPDFSFGPDRSNEQFGYAVACAGDVNSDGYSDVLVGLGENKLDGWKGKAYIYYGSKNGLNYGIDGTGDEYLIGVGEANNNFFGSSLAGAGDLNKDGYDDVIIGAYGYESKRGRAYVYYGSAKGLVSKAEAILTGEGLGDQFSLALSNIGDINSDGYSDIIIGAPYNQSKNGKAYIFYGSVYGLGEKPAIEIYGDGGCFGGAVARIGDLNNDSLDEFFVSAYDFNLSQGRVYIYEPSLLPIYPNSTYLYLNDEKILEQKSDINKTVSVSFRSKLSDALVSANNFVDDYSNKICRLFLNLSAKGYGIVRIKNLTVDYTYSVQIPDFRDVLNAEPNETIILNFTGKNGSLKLSKISITYDHPPTVELISPRNGAIITKEQVTLSWKGKDEENDTLKYYVYLDEEPDPKKIIEYQKETSLTKILQAGKKYYWKIVANDGFVNGTPSPIYSFTINLTWTNYKPTVSLLSPTNGSVLSSVWESFSWVGEDKDGHQLMYYVYIDRIDGKTTLVSYQKETTYIMKGL
ncbi:MAG: FG-GAP-like repeat-containing protein, partial [Candidatus Thermoplasmatota archaeon]